MLISVNNLSAPRDVNKCQLSAPRDVDKCQLSVDNCRNVRGLGKNILVSRLFEKLRYSNERSTKFEILYQE